MTRGQVTPSLRIGIQSEESFANFESFRMAFQSSGEIAKASTYIAHSFISGRKLPL